MILKAGNLSSKCGYTIVEMMVTIVIVSVLSATVGSFVVKLLTLQEQEREAAYIRERLVDICGIYADYLSIGSSITNDTSSTVANFAVDYRQETGGVSFETGRVSRVVRLESSERVYSALNQLQRNLFLNAEILTSTGGLLSSEFAREFRGDDTPLVSTKELKIKKNKVDLNYRLIPLVSPADEFQVSPAIWRLEVKADYFVEKDNGVLVHTNAVVSRLVRLWNKEDRR